MEMNKNSGIQVSYYIQRRPHLLRIPSYDPSTLFLTEITPFKFPVIKLLSSAISHIYGRLGFLRSIILLENQEN
jgi:hypothetical protein